MKPEEIRLSGEAPQTSCCALPSNIPSVAQWSEKMPWIHPVDPQPSANVAVIRTASSRGSSYPPSTAGCSVRNRPALRSSSMLSCGTHLDLSASAARSRNFGTSSRARERSSVPLGVNVVMKESGKQTGTALSHHPSLITLLISQLVQMRDRVLLCRHEFQQRRSAAVGGSARSDYRVLDVARMGDAFRPAAHRLGDVRVVAAQIAGLEQVVRGLH